MAEVTGRVTVDGLPRAGVAVSDGGMVVLTDSDGRYRLTLDGIGRYVWVTTPGDAWIEPFYQPVPDDGVVDFAMESRDFSSHRVAYITDLHLENTRRNAVDRFAADLDRLNAREPAVDVVVMGGDVCLQAGLGDSYVELCSRLRMPVRHGMGNHDFKAREADPFALYESRFGPRYYSFRLGDVHYLTVCGQVAHPEYTDYRDIFGHITPRELAWLAADLAARPTPGPVVMFSHIAFATTYGPRRKTTNAENPWWNIGNADEVIPLLAEHGCELVCQGHLHENETIVRDGISFVSTVSIGGRWWWHPEDSDDTRAVSGEPRGWRLIEGDGRTVTHRVVAADPALDGLAGEVMERDGECWFNLFDGRPGQVVEADFGDGWRKANEELYPGGLWDDAFEWPHCYRLGPAGGEVRVRVDSELVWPIHGG